MYITAIFILQLYILQLYMLQQYTVLAINNNPSCYCSMNISLKLNILKIKKDLFFDFFLLK